MAQVRIAGFLRGVTFLVMAATPQVSAAANWKNQSDSTVTWQVGLSNPKLEMIVEDKNKLGPQLIYAPHSPTSLALSLSYRWLGVTLGSVLPNTDKDNALKGYTTGIDYQFRFNWPRHTLDAFYQRYKGYYLDNTNTVQAQPEGTPYLQYPDLQTEKIGLGVTFMSYPDDFSLSAAFDHSAQQTSSGWSPFLNVVVAHTRFSSPSTLIPTPITGVYGEFEKVRAAQLYSAAAGGGVGFTLVPYSYYFLSAALSLSFGLEAQRVEKTDATTTNSVNTNAAAFKLGAGYNGDGFIASFTMQVDNTSYNIENARVGFNTISVGLFTGSRF